MYYTNFRPAAGAEGRRSGQASGKHDRGLLDHGRGAGACCVLGYRPGRPARPRFQALGKAEYQPLVLHRSISQLTYVWHSIVPSSVFFRGMFMNNQS